MSWANRLAALANKKLPHVDSADSADSVKLAPIGTFDTNDTSGFPEITSDDVAERAAIQAEALPVRRLRSRPMSWAQAEDIPSPGDFCGCCAGALWWEAVPHRDGWHCAYCRSPSHLPAEKVRVVAT